MICVILFAYFQKFEYNVQQPAIFPADDIVWAPQLPNTVSHIVSIVPCLLTEKTWWEECFPKYPLLCSVWSHNTVKSYRIYFVLAGGQSLQVNIVSIVACSFHSTYHYQYKSCIFLDSLITQNNIYVILYLFATF